MRSTVLKGLVGAMALALIAAVVGGFRVPAVEAETCYDCLEWTPPGGHGQAAYCCVTGDYSMACQFYLDYGELSFTNMTDCTTNSQTRSCDSEQIKCGSGSPAGGGGGGPLLPTPDDCTYDASGYCPAWCGECTWPGSFGF